jgi:phage terminase small subunit
MGIEEKFTEKQKLFCAEYLKDLNATKAAIRAGYSEASAKEQGYQLLQLQHVQEEINKLNEERMNRIKVDGDYVIMNLKSICDDDIKNYLEFKVSKTGRLTIKWKDLKDVDTRNISEFTKDKTGFKFKRYSRDNALQLLGRHLGLFQDQINIKSNMEKLLSEYSENGVLTDAGIEKLAEIILAHHKKLNNGQ